MAIEDVNWKKFREAVSGALDVTLESTLDEYQDEADGHKTSSIDYWNLYTSHMRSHIDYTKKVEIILEELRRRQNEKVQR